MFVEGVRASPATEFKAGQSGNPNGRPKHSLELRGKCRLLRDDIIERLKQILMESDNDSASVAAAKLLLAYGYGAPPAEPVNDDEGSTETTSTKWSPEIGKEILTSLRKLEKMNGPTDAEH